MRSEGDTMKKEEGTAVVQRVVPLAQWGLTNSGKTRVLQLASVIIINFFLSRHSESVHRGFKLVPAFLTRSGRRHR